VLIQSHQGGCICGALRYEFSGEPTGSMICHCRTCRRLTAGPVVAWLSVPATNFRFIQGSPQHYRSSTPIERSFCSACGTHVSYTNANDAQEVEVATCTLDDPNAFPPTHHSWLSHDVSWLRFGDGLPAFQRSRYGPA
jgi:hypothetical protein